MATTSRAPRITAAVLLLSIAGSHAFQLPSRLAPVRKASIPPMMALQMSSSNDDEDAEFNHNTPSRRTRKRDILRKCWGSARLTVHNQKHALSPLRMLKQDDDNENATNDSTSNNDTNDKFSLEKLSSNVKDRLPTKVVELFEQLLQKLQKLFPSLKVAFISFAAGAMLTLGAILVPIYSQVETLSEPVTLFETILGDLDRGYVDKVDTEKLFETGISAMLRSLDPYTEFEGKQEAQDLSETIDGKYGGVGLVISGATPKDLALMKKVQEATTTTTPAEDAKPSKLLPVNAIDSSSSLTDGDDVTSSNNVLNDDEDDDDAVTLQSPQGRKALAKVRERGITVVSAFEGYAFDYGMRVGDRLVSIDGTDISPDTSVEEVRNKLRGEPGSAVQVAFERVGVDGVQTVSIPRTVVKIRDVKLATLVGDPKDGVGYIQLTGFASDAGREVRNAITYLQQAAEDATNGESSLQGLILDLRGNPGGLLTSAVDVASSLVPKGSDIVSARGRGFPGILYRSRIDPVLDNSKTKLAVLVNSGTASAAEIVSGAVQDLDVGIIVGSDRTFGKGLVQNVEDLPFNTALKFTVAKYYTPSGRCIQGVNYSEGGGLNAEDGGRFVASKVADKDRETFYTKSGREVKDGGGVEADYKISAPKASALEVTLLRSGIVGDFAAQWSKAHELSNNFEVDEETYREFQSFVQQKQKDGDLKLEALYAGPLGDLKKILTKSGYKGSTKELESLKNSILREVWKDFDKYRNDIKEDVAQGILARYVPESMLIERSIKTDTQVKAAVKLVRNGRQFDRILAKGSESEEQRLGNAASSSTLNAAIDKNAEKGARLNLKW